MKNEVMVDVAVFGGGVAGLWLLTRIRQAGFSAVLFDSGSLGGGQTYKSQGIIHGGMKYALQGLMTQEARGMTEMPTRWKTCLSDAGEINLSDVKVLSDLQYLFAPNKLTAKLAGFFASKSLSSNVMSLQEGNYPAIFQHDAFKGVVYALDEMVLDVPSLVLSLVKRNQEVVFKIEPFSPDEMHYNADGSLKSVTVYQNGKSINAVAKQFIFAAGNGNEVITKKWNDPSVDMQRRPLHMVLVKMKALQSLYAHCLGFGARPRLTITTHYTHDGSPVWYLGGLIAEEGVNRSSAEQILVAKKELTALFPWIDFNEASFATVRVDRAEPKQAGGLKPEGVFLTNRYNQLLVWPTKLALTPQLADDVMAHFQKIALTHEWCDLRQLRTWPMPTLAKPIWEEAFCKSVV